MPLRPLLFGLLVGAAAFGQQPPRLVMIEIDGFDARFLNDPSLHVKIPNIRALVRKGVSASVAGSAAPDEWAPLLLAGQRSNRKVATIYCPPHPGLRPAFSFPEAEGKTPGAPVPFEAVAQKAAPASMVDSVEAMFPRFQKELWDDSSSAQAATWVLATGSPDLLMVHLADVESEERGTGALSVYAREALENDDELIGQILAKAPRDAVVAIVSNHGVENANYVVRPAVMLRQLGQAGDVEVSHGLIGTRDPAVADRLRKLIMDRKRRGIAREVPMAEVRARVPALASWVAAFGTPPNFIASAEKRGPALGPGTHLAVWDFWPTRPGFRSVFVMAGPNVPNRKLGDIDIAAVVPALADSIAVKLSGASSPALLPGSQKD